MLKRLWTQEKEISLFERRKRYWCKNKFVALEDVNTWSDLSKNNFALKDKERDSNLINENSFFGHNYNSLFNSKISIWKGPITTLEVDALVNSANTTLLGGGGVDYAVHAGAGPELLQECKLLHGTDVGTTKITRGYNLPARFVLHTVGPSDRNSRHLESCYDSCLEFFKLKSHNDVNIEDDPIRSISFCAISTGVYGYPLEDATHIAFSVTRKWMEKNIELVGELKRIVFVAYSEKEYNCFVKLMPQYFPYESNT